MLLVDCHFYWFNFPPMKRPVFKENSRAVRSSDLFKYLLQNETDQATKAAQKQYKDAMFKGYRWIDLDADIEWALCRDNEANLQAMRGWAYPRTPAPRWPTL